MKKHNTAIDKFIDAPEWNMISDLNSNTGLYRFLNNDVILDANASYILLKISLYINHSSKEHLKMYHIHMLV